VDNARTHDAFLERIREVSREKTGDGLAEFLRVVNCILESDQSGEIKRKLEGTRECILQEMRRRRPGAGA
jgi:hypothetical protein